MLVIRALESLRRKFLRRGLWFKTLSSVEGLEPIYTSPRPGDIRHSLADISKIMRAINFKPKTPLEEGLRLTLQGD